MQTSLKRRLFGRCDYAEALKPKFDIEIKPEAFGFNHNESIEGSTFEYNNKYHNDISNQEKVKMDFQSHFHMALLRM